MLIESTQIKSNARVKNIPIKSKVKLCSMSLTLNGFRTFVNNESLHKAKTDQDPNSFVCLARANAYFFMIREKLEVWG